MSTSVANVHLNDAVTTHMRQDFTRLSVEQTIGEALHSLRQNPPRGRLIYFYVVDDQGHLHGVVPTQRLVLHAPQTPLADIMVRPVIALPATATVSEACEFFAQHRLLAFPVVDEQGRLLGGV